MSKLGDYYNQGLGYAAVTLTAGEAIAVGDLVTLGADGKAYWAADPTSTGAPFRPISTPATVGIASTGAISLAVTAAETGPQTSAVLSNGNIVTVYYNASNTYFVITTQLGANVVPATVIAASSSGVNPSVIALSGGGFAVFYASVTNTPTLVTYSNAGVVVVASVAVDTTFTFYSTGSPLLVQLSNTNIAVAWSSSNTVTSVRTAVYTSALVSVLASTLTSQASTNISNQQGQFGIVALSGGGYVVSWTSSNIVYAKVYTNTGTITTGQFTIASLSATAYNSMVALTGGGFAVATGPAAGISTGVSVAVFNSVGTQQGSSFTNTGNTSYAPSNNTEWSLVSLTGNAVAVVYNGAANGTIGYAILTALGVVSFSGTYTPTASYSINFNVIGTGTPDGNAFFIHQATSSAAASFSLNATTGAIAIGFVPTIISTVILNNAQLFSFASSSTSLPITFVLIAGQSGNSLNFQNFTANFQRLTFAGVAVAAAISGGTFAVQQAGTATTRLTFSQPYSFDGRPSGVAMSVFTNNATLTNFFANTSLSRTAINVAVSSGISYTVPLGKMLDGYCSSSATSTVSVNGVNAIFYSAGVNIPQSQIKANGGDVISATASIYITGTLT